MRVEAKQQGAREGASYVTASVVGEIVRDNNSGFLKWRGRKLRAVMWERKRADGFGEKNVFMSRERKIYVFKRM